MTSVIPGVVNPGVVQAAGAVCWRETPDGIEIVVVHRAERADTGLPKGKVDPGETPPQTAVREISEETGLAVSLGAPLGFIEYLMPGGREKIVHFWSAEVSESAISESTFEPNDEIARVEWLPVEAAHSALTYERDQDVLDRFVARITAGTLRTFPVIVLRHGKAVAPAAWDGPDSTRPLLHRGLEQSQNIAAALAAWAPRRLISSTAARCRATLEPLAQLTGLAVKETEYVSQDAYEEGTARVRHVVRKRLLKQQPVVICSHGPVIPELIDELAALTNTPLDAQLRRSGMLSTAEYTVVHISTENPDAAIVAIETHGPALL